MSRARSTDAAAPADTSLPARAENGVCRIVLPAAVTIAQVSALHTSILEAFSAGGSIELDAAGVVQIDMAGLQLLLALHEDARLSAVPLWWISASAPVREAAVHAGLVDLLGLGAGEAVAMPQ